MQIGFKKQFQNRALANRGLMTQLVEKFWSMVATFPTYLLVYVKRFPVSTLTKQPSHARASKVLTARAT